MVTTCQMSKLLDNATFRVLKGFYRILDYGLKNPGILSGDSNYPYGIESRVTPVQMRPDEVQAWDKLFGITSKVLAAGEAIKVPDVVIPPSEFDSVCFKVTKEMDYKSLPKIGGCDVVFYDGKYIPFRLLKSIILPGKPRHYELVPFNSNGMRSYIQPHAYLERKAYGAGLYS